ncbi:MAG TPA: TetR/AcrR family transcriptional regulator [Alphaproteobacteria bacterium]|jgi:AcrR family transcriptional regulator|nr:TetR/AcrR family transcriptional regulator [Alphaproteobacteria bacterium]
MKAVNKIPGRRGGGNAGSRRQPEKTREQILEAALAEFSQKGLGGARIDAIASRAGVNKRMIYHYFGNKDELFSTVLISAYEAFRQNDASLTTADLDPLEGMHKLVEFTFNYMQENRHLVALLNSANLHRGRHLQNSDRIRELYSPLIDMIAALLLRGERSGIFRTGVDPVNLYISIAGLAYFYFSNIHTLSAVFGRDLEDPALVESQRRHVVELVLASLRVGAGPELQPGGQE